MEVSMAKDHECTGEWRKLTEDELAYLKSIYKEAHDVVAAWEKLCSICDHHIDAKVER
jgi:hypothetical protein